MIIEEELKSIGFKYIGDDEDENSKRFKALFQEQIYGTGNYMYLDLKDGTANIIGIPYKINNIDRIKLIINVLGLHLDE